MDSILNKISELGIVPFVKIENADDAIPLGRALLKGELPIAEITFRTKAAEQAIKNLTEKVPEILVGAGTVLTVEQVKKAVGAGSKFIVSPGFNPKVVDHCVKNSIPVTPGISSPTQIEMALEYGLKAVKFFPAEACGGLKLLKAMSAPYGDMKFIPTGGINADNLLPYLSFNKVLACGGSWMVKADLISAGKFDEITALTKQAMNSMLGFELKHVGINENDSASALSSAKKVDDLFGFAVKEGKSSIFNASFIEIMKSKYLGEYGHLAIGTNYIHRAIAYLGRKGIKILPDSAKEKNGALKAIYLDMDVSGFAIHLLQK